MKPFSIATQMTIFTLAVLAGATLLSFSIALALPPPPPGRISVDEIAWALAGNSSNVINIEFRDHPPAGGRVSLVEVAAARSLGVARERVRAVWSDTPTTRASRGQSVIRIDGRDVLVDASATGFHLRYGDGTSLRSDTLLPLVTVALRERDGQWATALPENPARTAWVMRIAAALMLGFLAVLPLALLVSRRITRPIRRLSMAAELARPADLDPFPEEGPQELRATAAAMNAMHARIREQSAKRIANLAGMAHDLRTPVTALKLRVHGLPPEHRRMISDDINRVAELASAMLDDATIGAYVPTFVPIDLAGLLRSCSAAADPTGGIEVRAFGPTFVSTDSILAKRLISNLLENARRFGTNVVADVVSNGSYVLLTVADDGPGIPDGSVTDALQPYRQLSHGDGSGIGLGLAVVRDIAAAIGVSVTFCSADPGLRVEVRFVRQ